MEKDFMVVGGWKVTVCVHFWNFFNAQTQNDTELDKNILVTPDPCLASCRLSGIPKIKKTLRLKHGKTNLFSNLYLVQLSGGLELFTIPLIVDCNENGNENEKLNF